MIRESIVQLDTLIRNTTHLLKTPIANITQLRDQTDEITKIKRTFHEKVLSEIEAEEQFTRLSGDIRSRYQRGFYPRRNGLQRSCEFLIRSFTTMLSHEIYIHDYPYITNRLKIIANALLTGKHAIRLGKIFRGAHGEISTVDIGKYKLVLKTVRVYEGDGEGDEALKSDVAWKSFKREYKVNLQYAGKRFTIPFWGGFLQEDSRIGVMYFDQGKGDLFDLCNPALRRVGAPPLRITAAFCDKVIRDLIHLLCEYEALNIVHLDLKPENIVKTKKGWKACDLAFLCRAGERTSVGTLRYLPPNRLPDYGPVTTKDDIWTFGLIILDLLTAFESVYKDEDVVKEAFRTQEFHDAYLSKIPRIQPHDPEGHIKKLIVACLRVNRDERPKGSELLTIYEGRELETGEGAAEEEKDAS